MVSVGLSCYTTLVVFTYVIDWFCRHNINIMVRFSKTAQHLFLWMEINCASSYSTVVKIKDFLYAQSFNNKITRFKILSTAYVDNNDQAKNLSTAMTCRLHLPTIHKFLFTKFMTWIEIKVTSLTMILIKNL